MTLLFALACSSTPEPAAPAPAPAPAKAAPAKAKSAAPDPLAGKSKKEMCESDSLALLKWPYDDLNQGFGKICCGTDALGPDADACMMDWPFNDVPDCSAYAYMRNSIFARYGYTFSKPTYQDAFAKAEWYTPREDFDASWMNEVAKANVAKLKQLEKDKVMCEDYPDH